MLESRRFADADLERFRRYQRSSYAILEDVAATIRPGDSERLVARRLGRAYARAGVRGYFHVPVALFGERTAYPGHFGAFEALPTARRYAAGEAIILDAAPLFDGYTVDTSLAVPVGSDAAFVRADALLCRLRELVLERVRARVSMQRIAHQVDDAIRVAGLENCHRKHIGAVLGHRLTRVPAWLSSPLPRLGLTPLPVAWFFATGLLAARGLRRLVPTWNHARSCDQPPQDGLWAIEPHVGDGRVGVKFEEILVIAGGEPRWLDDDLPHHRRWRAAIGH